MDDTTDAADSDGSDPNVDSGDPSVDAAGPSADLTVEDRVAAVHDALAATAELPVDPGASAWLGEAEAVVADLRDDSLPPAVLHERLSHVRDLLDAVDGTDNPEADERVRAARDHAAAALSALGEQ